MLELGNENETFTCNIRALPLNAGFYAF